MANKAKEARARRTAARDRRRSGETEPSEDVDPTPEEEQTTSSHRNGELVGAAAKVVGTAVAAGLLGALGGAAKALLERRREEPRSTQEQEGDDGDDAAPEDDGGEPAALAEDDDAREDEQPEPEAAEERAPRAEGKGKERVQGVSGDEAAKIVASARRQLEGLLGTEAERVSGLERADGNWYVMLEVVEVARIPESTDVLATYELVLDDEGNLVSATRGRRYRRSQIDVAS